MSENVHAVSLPVRACDRQSEACEAIHEALANFSAIQMCTMSTLTNRER
jgi:hypothetical protein